MKILAYTPTYYGAGHNAGSETTLHGLLVAAKRAGHDVSALVSRPHKDGSGSFVLDGVKVQAFSSKHDPQLHFPQADLIITQFECAQRAHLIANELSIPTVQVVHNNTEYATNLARRYNGHLIYNAEHVKKSIEATFGTFETPKSNILVRPIINPKLYNVETSREYITLINLSDGTEPFYDKGYRVFYCLAERFPNLKFLGVKGAYGKQQIPANLPSNVTIMEHTNNILDVYRKTKVILVPSKIESWGRVPIEAAASAIPSLTSTAPGLLESGIGYDRIPCDNYDQWAIRLQDLLNDYDHASAEARVKAERLHLSNEYEVQSFLEFIEKISLKRG